MQSAKHFVGFLRWPDKRSFSIFDEVKNYLCVALARFRRGRGNIDWRFKFLAEEKIRFNIAIKKS